MIDQVLVAETLSENALAQHGDGLVRDEGGFAMISEASRLPLAVSDPLVGGRDGHHAAIRRDRTAVERVHKFVPAGAYKVHLGLVTVSVIRGASPTETEVLKSHQHLVRVGSPMLPAAERKSSQPFKDNCK